MMSIKTSIQALSLLLWLGTAVAWNMPPSTRQMIDISKAFGERSSGQNSRQDFLGSLKNVALMGILGVPSDALAAPPKKVPPYVQERGSLESGLGPCPGQPMKKSCWSSEDTENRRVERWVPPSSLKGNAKAIATALEETMSAYPQEGQNDVDRGGWKLAERNTDGRGGTYLRYEFTSGRFKYIDELELLVEGSTGKVSVRTASRSAGFDYNVNSTRLNYIQKALEKKGWKVTLV